MSGQKDTATGDSPSSKAAPSNSGVPTNLKSYVDRLTRLEGEKRSIAADIKDLKTEAKANEIDPKVLVAVVKRAMEDAEQKEKRQAFEEKFDAYAFTLSLLD